MVARTDYSLGFTVALMLHVVALFLLGMAPTFITDRRMTDVQPPADTIALSLVEDLLSDNASSKKIDAELRPPLGTHLEILRVSQSVPEHPLFTDLSSDRNELPIHALPDYVPPSPTIVMQTPSALPDKTIMPTLSPVLSSQETMDPSSQYSDTDGGLLQGTLIAPTTKAQAIHPKYPMTSRRRGEQGRVILDVLVSNKGHATSVTFVSSSGFRDLDVAAKDAIMQAEFKPGERNGKAVEAAARITILFQLNQN
ncbi:MAG: energy transducer TonB [bacterium]